MMTAITINLNNVVKLTDEQFYQLCQDNPDVKLERNQWGELIVMPPTAGEKGIGLGGKTVINHIAFC